MNNLKTGDINYFSCKITGDENKSENVDPVTAEIVRHSPYNISKVPGTAYAGCAIEFGVDNLLELVKYHQIESDA